MIAVADAACIAVIVITERETLPGRELVRGVCSSSVTDDEIRRETGKDVAGFDGLPKVERSALKTESGRAIILQSFSVTGMETWRR